ncbi:MAG: hypothetical protein EXR99_03130 [Gemmataceae bacterium]|nr:hypothetical protein [Gemmataceae bacterium]
MTMAGMTIAVFANQQAALAGWESWIIPLIAFAVFILSSLKKVAEPGGAGNKIPFSPTHSDLNKFLEEARQRREGKSAQEPFSPKENEGVPFAVLAAPATSSGVERSSREVPALTPLQIIEERIRKKKTRPAKAKPRPAAHPTPPPATVSTMDAREQFQPSRVTSAPTLNSPTSGVALPSASNSDHNRVGSKRFFEKPHEGLPGLDIKTNSAIAEALALLRSAKSLRSMFIMQEILSPPLVNRKVRRK